MFLDILERCPHLEQLVYCCDLSERLRRWEHPPARPRLVMLSRLKELRLAYQPFSWMSTLLGSLDIAATHAYVQVTAFVEHDRADLPFDMLPPDTSRVMPLSSIRSLDLNHDFNEEIRLTLRPDLSECWLGPIGIVDVLLQGGHPDFVHLAYPAAFERLDVSQLEKLTLEEQSCDAVSLPYADLSFCLQRTKNLRQLRLINMSPETVAATLSLLFTPVTGGHDDGDVICPQLSRLELILVYHDREIERLFAACMQRASSRQIPLKTVKLEGIGWSQQPTEGLQWEGSVVFECL